MRVVLSTYESRGDVELTVAAAPERCGALVARGVTPAGVLR